MAQIIANTTGGYTTEAVAWPGGRAGVDVACDKHTGPNGEWGNDVACVLEHRQFWANGHVTEWAPVWTFVGDSSREIGLSTGEIRYQLAQRDTIPREFALDIGSS
jgi:hypothetical protein